MAFDYYSRKPEWLRIKLPAGAKSATVMSHLNHRCLNTICTSGLCPNRAECWGNGTATFMIGGDTCTRACRFCNVKTGRPAPLDADEPRRVVDTIEHLGLKHIVLTSVDRDDLPDGGASHWVAMLRELRARLPHVTVETLIPDFRGDADALNMVLTERPDVVSHNMETVRRLTPAIRSVATYDRSLDVIRTIANAGLKAKSGIMLGLGETQDEIETTLDDLINAGCSIVTIGQYLQPTEHHVAVERYVTPEEFAAIGQTALAKGFRHVESAPLVRSSYHAERHLM